MHVQFLIYEYIVFLIKICRENSNPVITNPGYNEQIWPAIQN